MQIDLPYLCTTIGNLSGVPVRIFEGEKLTFYYSQAYLPRDPMAVYRDQIFAVKAMWGMSQRRIFITMGSSIPARRKL